MILKEITEHLLDWFFPRRCVFCDDLLKSGEKYLCRKCRVRMPSPIQEPRCKRCGKPLVVNEQEYCYDCLEYEQKYDRGIGIFTYQDPMKQALMRLKFKGRKEYGDFLGRLMCIYGEEFIKQMFNDSNKNTVFIQRNELADQFRCAPSQINYVLTTRFTYEKGYLIESKRGGGGHIAIKQLEYGNPSERERLINKSIGETITYHNALALLNNLLESGIIKEREYEIMKIAINDRSLSSSENKNKIRADILKAMITVILS